MLPGVLVDAVVVSCGGQVVPVAEVEVEVDEEDEVVAVFCVAGGLRPGESCIALVCNIL